MKTAKIFLAVPLLSVLLSCGNHNDGTYSDDHGTSKNTMSSDTGSRLQSARRDSTNTMTGQNNMNDTAGNQNLK